MLAPIFPHLPTIVYLLGLSGLLGSTMFFSLASDLLALLTFHVFVFYLMVTSLFRWHLSMLHALFNIFRGEPRNTVQRAVLKLTFFSRAQARSSMSCAIESSLPSTRWTSYSLVQYSLRWRLFCSRPYWSTTSPSPL